MLNFKEITIQGFGSIIKPITYKLDTPGINLILGDNGVGKTTILNALTWCLYKQTIKERSDVTPWAFLVEDKAYYVGTKVEVTFHVGHEVYTVARFKHYKGKYLGRGKLKNACFLVHNGDIVDRFRNLDDVNKGIEEAVGMSYTLFKNAVLFGQGVKKILEENGPTTKSIFDECLGADFVAIAKKLAEENLKDTLEELTAQSSVLDKHIAQHELLSEKLSKSGAIYKAQLSQYREMKARIKSEIHKSKDAIKGKERELSRYEANIEAAELTRSALQDKVASLEATLDSPNKDDLDKHVKVAKLEDLESKLQKQIKDLRNKKYKLDDLCPECGKPLYDVTQGDKKQLEQEKSKDATLLGELQQKLKDSTAKKLLLSASLEKLELAKATKQKALRTARGELSEATAEVQNLLSTARYIQETDIPYKIKTLASYEKEYSRLKKPTRDLELVESLKVDIEKAKAEIDKLDASVKQLSEVKENLQWAIRAPLSNSGLKNFIFTNALVDINENYIPQYSRFIGFGIEYFIDLESSRKDVHAIIYRGAHPVSYDDLSGAQKQLANVATALALNDYVCRGRSINVMFMDEVFESLAKKNIEVVTDLIRHKARTRSIHLITHQDSFAPINASILELKLDKRGCTYISK